jgi:Carboxypeptidase regulatory-like domain/TonB dependent receptor-like, beta-barrel
MRGSHPRFRTILLVLASLTLTVAAQAQYRASIQGVITDPQGAVVEGATVTLIDTQTNRTVTSTSDANGIYNFHALPLSTYTVSVEKSGFKKKTIDNYVPIADQPNGLNLELELGGATETVNVSAEDIAPIETQTATISGTVNSNQVQHLPSFGRDVFQLIQLAPGVFGDGRQGGGGGGANLAGTQGPGATGGSGGIFQTENGPQALAAGQQYENNSITIDGISTTSAVWGGTTIITPSEDSVENVKVVSHGYDAENGRFSGAQVQVTSKSGTNQFHGSLFWTAHRPGLNAYQRFNGEGNKVLRDTTFFNQLGGSVGGPIWKNKIFAFFAYETVREPQHASTDNGWYETSAFDGLAPAGSIAATYLTFPGGTPIGGSINTTATCSTAGFVEGVNCATIAGQGLDIGSPLTTGLGNQDLGWVDPQHPGVGGGLDGVPDIANFSTAGLSKSSKAQYNGRLDANVTEKDRLAFAIYWVPTSSDFINGPARQYNVFHHNQINEAFSAIWNHTFSATLLNEFRVNAAGWHWNEITSNPQSPVGLPQDRIDHIGGIDLKNFGANPGSILNQWTYSYKDVATKVFGPHTVKFGGDLTRLFYLNQCVGCGIPGYDFFNIWDFLNDAPHNESGSFDSHTGFPSTFRQDDRTNIWGFFVQDDWKVRRNLTLNLGLRWSYFGALYAKQDNMYRAIPGAGANYVTGLVVRKQDSWNPEKGNFGPQIGFAWSPGKFNDKFVVRGGYGLSYNQEEIAISANINTNPGLFIFPTLSMSTPTSPNPGIVYATSTDPHSIVGFPPNPNTIVSFGPNGLPTTGSVNVGIFPQDLPTMRVHHYSLDTQYDLGHRLIAILGYQGSLSRNIYFHENPNALPASRGYNLNPQIGGGDYWGVSGRGNYNALLAELKHDFSHQFMADAQFTWSKSMDTSSGPYFEQPYVYNLDLDYGRSDYNVGKSFKLFGMWQPVFFRGSKSWLEKIAGGWSISGILNVHSGFPWTPLVSVQGGSIYCGQCGYSALFPASYLGGAGSSTSNERFKSVANSNFPNGGNAYFSTPTYTAFSGTTFGGALPQSPGVRRNSLNGPGYKDVDLTLTKAFGLPTMPVLGEAAKVEFRLDAYNVFNNLNFKTSDPNDIANNIGDSSFGRARTALAARVVTLGARFNF